MRIACLHVPQFALQSLTRIDPSLRGAPVAVVGARLDAPPTTSIPGMGPGVGSSRALSSPVVQACSRAAWALGIRLGMTALAAHALVPRLLRVVTVDPQLERETVRALADALLGVSPVVDAGGRVGAGGPHLALYCEVPSKIRGTSFGERLLEVLATLGLTGRIGIADDRFTAWVAAVHGGASVKAVTIAGAAGAAGVAGGMGAGRGEPVSDEGGVVSVPRGGSAAFLSPRPLSLLAISPEVQHMLEALGVHTLGEFAALPAPSVARPRNSPSRRTSRRSRAGTAGRRSGRTCRRRRSARSSRWAKPGARAPRRSRSSPSGSRRGSPGAAGARPVSR